MKNRFETVESPFWISYADLMTALVMLLLMVITVSMVAIASRPLLERKERERGIAQIFDQMERKLQEQALDVTLNRATQTLSFGEKARFARDSYLLSGEAKRQLQAVVPLLLQIQTTPEGGTWLKRVHIEGYTDESGTYLYNVHLSLRRAQSVVCALFEQVELSHEEQHRLQSLLMIDGATVTSMKARMEESRRVEIRLEFRAIGDQENPLPMPEMVLGRCPIQTDEDLRKR